jgi:hypothetical protein
MLSIYLPLQPKKGLTDDGYKGYQNRLRILRHFLSESTRRMPPVFSAVFLRAATSGGVIRKKLY